jgi:protein involved in polysaccharide export with SLBB domain
MLSADLAAALRDPEFAKNVALMPRTGSSCSISSPAASQLLSPILEEVRRQSRIDQPSELVRIDGRVKARGDYPLEPNMHVSDLLRAGGGLQDAAYGAKAELTRYRIERCLRQTQLLEIDLAAIMSGDASADLMLQPFDFLNVKEVPEWSEQEQVTLIGEVRFPGNFPIQRGETLRSVLERAGGLTSLAFPSGSVFTRLELREREQEQIDRLADRLQSDLASAALRAAAANQGQAGQALTVGQSLLTQLKATKAVGRLVINLNDVLNSPVGSVHDIVMREGDSSSFPSRSRRSQSSVKCRTILRTSIARNSRATITSGCLVAPRARPTGQHLHRARRRQRGLEREQRMVPPQRAGGDAAGDTIVVPLDTERMPALPMWQAVTSILYNLAIAAAAVNSF